MAYVSLGSRKRSLGGGSGSSGRIGRRIRGWLRHRILERWPGHQHDGHGPVQQHCLSDSMKPPPGELHPSSMPAAALTCMHKRCVMLWMWNAGLLSVLSLQGTRLPPL